MCVFGDEHFGYGQCFDGAVGWRGLWDGCGNNGYGGCIIYGVWGLGYKGMNAAWVYGYRR